MSRPVPEIYRIRRRIGVKSQISALISNILTPWQPKVGDKVIVVGAENKPGLQFIGKKGTVEKNQGAGFFRVQLEKGPTISVRSVYMKKI